MTSMVQGRSKIPVVTDIVFAYTISAFLTISLPSSPQEIIITLTALGGVLGSVLSLLKPVERLLLLVTKRRLMNSTPSPVAVEQAFDTGFLDNPKIKIKTGVYVSMAFIFFLTKPLESVSQSLWSALIIIAILLVIPVTVKEALKFSSKTLVVALYHGLVSRYGLSTFHTQRDVLFNCIASSRRALEMGNWQEALTFITRYSLVGGYKTPKDMLDM